MVLKPVRVFGFIISLMCIVFFNSACGSGGGDSNNPVDNGNGNGNGNGDLSAFLPTADKVILENASQSFDTLVASGSYESAREAIVKELKATDGVKTAALLEDGVTVWMVFDDGMNAVVNTMDFDALNEGVSNIDYETLKPAVENVRAKPTSIAAPVAVEHNYSSPSQKVLMLNIAEPTMPSSNNANKLRDILLTSGWSNDDITIKTRKDRYDNSIQPSDLFNLGDYGIVVIYAHGLYGTPPDSSVTNNFHYLQVCSDLLASDPLSPQYREWMRAGKIVLSDKCGVYMRSDLLVQMIERMPLTTVFFTVCWGWEARHVFFNNYCGAFFGWDDMVMAADAFPSLYQSFKLLTQHSPANTIVDTYKSDMVVKTSKNIFDRTAHLYVLPDFGEFYFPAWADVSVSTASIPDGTTHIIATGTYESTMLNRTTLQYLDHGIVDSLIPGRLSLSFTAVKGNVELAVNDRLVNFHPGKNEITLDFSYQKAPAQLLVHTYDPGHDWVSYATTFYTYFVWTRNPDGDSYHITYNRNNKTYGTSVVSIPNAGETFNHLKHCMGLDEVTALFGSNVFGISKNQVVFFHRGSHFEYTDPNDAEILKDIEKIRGLMIEDIKNEFYEVYYD